MPAQTLEPVDAAGVAAALSAATSDSLSVTVRGAGTKVSLPARDLVISTARMTGRIDHVAGGGRLRSIVMLPTPGHRGGRGSDCRLFLRWC